MNYRKIYEIALKEKVPKDFDVHHIDLNHENNDIKNLVAIPKTLHQKFHKCVNEIEQIRNNFKFEICIKLVETMISHGMPLLVICLNICR